MARVRYVGPVRGSAMLARDLEQAGFCVETSYESIEHRGVAQEAVRVGLQVGSIAGQGIIGAAAWEVFKKVVDKFHSEHPEVDVGADADDGDDLEQD